VTTSSPIARVPGRGWLVLLGGGEFSFEETEDADAAWLEKAGFGGRPIGESGVELGGDPEPVGKIGFLPAASGSEDYAGHFTVYLDEYFGQQVVTLPIYRGRDGRRGKNAERIDAVSHVYVGGGVADHLLDALVDTPCLAALYHKLESGGTVVAIAAGAQAFGEVVRSLGGGKLLPGFGWLPGGAIETNFESSVSQSSERRLRRLLGDPQVHWGVGIAAGSALLLGPEGEVEVVGDVHLLTGAEAELVRLEPTPV
jgi:cyanophycinase-like exopeptidase